MRKILFIATGGTIASELTDSGLEPGLDPESLLEYVPQVESTCRVDSVALYDLDSTNIGPEHWLGIAGEIRARYGAYDGFVISHGTDTMAYTAAALSYLIQGSPKPIILTGAQKPIDFDTTDSRVNLADSFMCACAGDMHNVNIVFGGRVISGTRARKTRSKSFTAFSSINFPHIAEIRDGELFQYIVPQFEPEPEFYDGLDQNVGLLKLIPSVDRELMEYMLRRHDALIIESFGVGGLPQRRGLHDLAETAAASGKIIIMTTQVQNEGSDMAVYSTGYSLVGHPGILEARDMTTESAVAKIMWILAVTRDPHKVREMFYTPVNRDIITPVRENEC